MVDLAPMIDKPILRLPNPRSAKRQLGSPNKMPRHGGKGHGIQAQRFQATFDRLEAALASGNVAVELSQDPGGIAPERALVFVTAAPISDFVRVARGAGLEVLTERELDRNYSFPEGLEPDDDKGVQPTLYATMPTIETFKQLLTLWRAYEKKDKAPKGSTPWWKLFDLLVELRSWGPEDRLNRDAFENILFDNEEEVTVELQIWPTSSESQRADWRSETEEKVKDLGGRILDRSSIIEPGFVYEAILAGLSAEVVRQMLDHPGTLNGLATLDGIQFILPQTIAQSIHVDDNDSESKTHQNGGFNSDAPFRALLLDGTPITGHEVLDGGIMIADIHEIVQLSQVHNRRHATSMASLILRGDLEAEGEPLVDSRVLAIPLLVDGEEAASSPDNRLFVDLVHKALMGAFRGDEPLAPDVFVVNFSIGIRGAHYSGRVSALARLLDWWAAEEGVLFVVSVGNISQDLMIQNMTSTDFESASVEERQTAVHKAIRDSRSERSLLAPAEALNVLSVGAASVDRALPTRPRSANMLEIHSPDEITPSISSALGLGPFSAIKPDFLGCGGIHDVQVIGSDPNGVRLRVLRDNLINGLHVASAVRGGNRDRGRARGTSCASALTTRSLLQAAEALTGEGGAFSEEELPRRDLALITRALAVNAAHWPQNAEEMYDIEKERLGHSRHLRAKEEVVRYYGYGFLDPSLMIGGPSTGVTLVGLGEVRKDQAKIFEMPLPPSLSEDPIPRSMQVTLTWFSPMEPARTRYRLATLEAIASDVDMTNKDNGWILAMKSGQLAGGLIKRGTVWSRRLVHDRVRTPQFESGTVIPIRVQCKDASGDGLSLDHDIRFAIAVTLQVEETAQYDVHEEVRNQLLVQLETP